MPVESWNEARLIPTSGINGAEEQERRATSALLAVMTAVREYGRALTRPFGAPAGTVETYIEVPFELAERRLFPDGLIQVSRGQTVWTALVEVKTGGNVLVAEQLENYLDVAREQGYDAVITISNEIPAVAGQHPTKVDGRKLRKVGLYHLSWTQVLAEAVMQKEFRGVADLTCYVDIDAPRDGRPTTRVNWLVRQLKEAPATVVLESHAARARGHGAAELLRVVREDPSVLVEDPSKELRSFRVALQRPMGAKRGRGRGSFIDSVLGSIDTFYDEVAAHLKAWSAKPAKMRSDRDVSVEDEVAPALASTAMSSQDEE